MNVGEKLVALSGLSGISSLAHLLGINISPVTPPHTCPEVGGFITPVIEPGSTGITPVTSPGDAAPSTPILVVMPTNLQLASGTLEPHVEVVPQAEAVPQVPVITILE